MALFFRTLCFAQSPEKNSRATGNTVIKVTVFTSSPVTVTISSKDEREILCYKSIDSSGQYVFEINRPKLDSLELTMRGFNIKGQKKIIRNTSQSINLRSSEQKLYLRQVVVKAKKITVKKDTINYAVSTFKNKTDYTVKDVMKKMPGIKIYSNGQIYYNGELVKNFYIENLDMLHGNSDIAINNIKADDVADVQVMEHHEPIKMFRKRKDRINGPAINLKLRNSAKGAWGANMLAEAGGTPTAWNGAVTAMYFSKKMQDISFVKTNNTGTDLATELGMGSAVSSGGTAGLRMQSPPDIEKKYYLMNNTNSATANHLFKLNKSKQITFNLSYLNDYQKRTTSDYSRYFVSQDSILEIDESQKVYLNTNNLAANIEYLDNSRKHYIKNSTKCLFKFSGGHGIITQNDNTIDQHLDNNSYEIYNSLYASKNHSKGKGYSSFSSNTSLYSKPVDLTIEPGLYYKLFGFEESCKQFKQNVRISGFKSDNSFSLLTLGVNHLKINLNGKINLNYQRFTSDLTFDKIRSNSIQSRNKIDYWKNEFIIQPYLIYFRQDFLMMLYLSSGYEDIYRRDGIKKGNRRVSLFNFQPYAYTELTTGDKIKISALYQHGTKYDDVETATSGVFFSNYRSLYNYGDYSTGKKRYDKSNLTVQYKDVFRMLFWSAKLNYLHYNNNFTGSSDYYGTLTIYDRKYEDNTSSNINSDIYISKGFQFRNSSISAEYQFGQQKNRYYVSGNRYCRKYDYAFLEICGSISPVPWMDLNIKSNTTSYSNYVNGKRSGKKITTVRNEFKAGIAFSDKTDLNLDLNHFYNKKYDDNKNKFLLSCKMDYKIKNKIFYFTILNILNTKKYEEVLYSGLNYYRHTYDIRSRTFLLGIRFTLF
ncbi:MAG: hypothetical protein LKI53_07345 [Bacteroidales bacterium]|nr:hypothetical protein [Bacteroidales bacterium]